MIYVGKESERQWRWLIHFAVQQKVRHHCKPTINHFFFLKREYYLEDAHMHRVLTQEMCHQCQVSSWDIWPPCEPGIELGLTWLCHICGESHSSLIQWTLVVCLLTNPKFVFTTTVICPGRVTLFVINFRKLR